MDFKNEVLPSEVCEISDGSVSVRVRLTSKHILVRQVDTQISMFRNTAPAAEDELADEGYDDIPEGFSPEAIAEFDAHYDDGEYDGDYDDFDADEYGDDPDRIDSIEKIYQKLTELSESLGAERDNTYVFETSAKMRQTVGMDGGEVIEISYNEDPASNMDETVTTITYAPTQNGRVSIIHAGTVMSSLICERGVRHISAYDTPIAPLEVAVYGKKCDVDLKYPDGGTIYLDYLVELRGMDVQRTHMSIEVFSF